MGSYSLARISSNGAIYDSNQNNMIPMHFKLLTDAVFAPIEGAQITCIPESDRGNAQVGRQDANRTKGNTESIPLPGFSIYAVYDYANALKFHGRMSPGRITISEYGNTVVDAQLTSIADKNQANTNPFTPTAQMISQGAGFKSR
jgi:hypothetical protein